MDNKKWYESKFIWYALLSGIAGVLLVMQNDPTAGKLAIINAFVVAVLRVLTNSPIK